MKKAEKQIFKNSNMCHECLNILKFEETGQQGKLKVELKSFMGGLNWKFIGKKDKLSIICHTGSYGRENGLFEVYPSWKNDVTGYLSFGQVQNWIKRLERREAKLK